VARLKGIDLRRHGSGNMGTTNVWRTMGPLYAAGTLAIDIAKGIGAVALGRWTGLPGLDAACGFLVIAGHNWPLSTSFRGGKGIATTCGTLILLAPRSLLILLPLWAALALSTGLVSLGSMVAAIAIPVTVPLLYPHAAGFVYLIGYAVFSAAMALYQHRENMARLCQGKERNLWRGKKEPQ